MEAHSIGGLIGLFAEALERSDFVLILSPQHSKNPQRSAHKVLTIFEGVKQNMKNMTTIFH
jgi:hypothetical protein